MHISKKLKSILARAPVLFLLLLIFTVGHPVRAQAADVRLKKDMKRFVSFDSADMDVIETNGAILEKMFPGTNFKDKSQYFAYYKLDTKATKAWTWSTAIEYWHKREFETDGNDNIHVPQKDLKKHGVVFSVNMENGNKGNGCGKQSFTKYRKTWNGPLQQVSSGYTGTLHYFCIDKGTEAGNALAKLKKEQKSKDNKVTFFVSPVIKNSKGPYHYDLNAWYKNTVKGVAYYWKDKIKANYRAHYNNKFVIEIPTVKITQNASLIGKRMKTSDSFKVQDKLQFGSKDTKWVRSLTASDYFFRPKFKDTKDGKEQVLLKVKDSKGKTK